MVGACSILTIGKPAGEMGKSEENHRKMEVYPLGSSNMLENALYIGHFPIETPMNRVDFQLPRLITGG